MRFLTVTCSILLAAGFAPGQTTPDQLVVKNYPADHFSISAPPGWIEIPKTELDEIAARVRATFPKAALQPYDYGFQLSRDAEYPRFLVQVKKSRRWSEDQFAKMVKSDRVKADVQHQLNSTSLTVAALNFQIGKLSWDAESRIAWLRAQFTSPEGVPMEVLTGTHLTELGSIQVNCYSAGSEFDRFVPLFSAVITSVRIEEPFRYRERSSLARVRKTIAIPALIGCGCCVGVVLIVRAVRRRKAGATFELTGKQRRLRAMWKIPLGLLLLFGHLSTLQHALNGDGWLQTSAEAQGYWWSWGFLVCLGVLLVYWGGRDLRSSQKPIAIPTDGASGGA